MPSPCCEKAAAGRLAFYALNIGLPLMAGLALYLVYKPGAYVSGLFASAGISLHGESLSQSALSEFIKNHAADIFWAYSLSFAVSAVLSGTEKQLLRSLLICLGFELMVELMQKIGLFAGTFDWLDILFEAIATVLSLQIIKIYEEKQK